MRSRLRHSVLLLPTLACAACVSAPVSIASRPDANQRASVRIGSTALWKIGAPSGQGYAVDIISIDGKAACTPSSCPSEVTLPAGAGKLGLRCSLLIGSLRLPKQTVTYSGNFLAGHVYDIRPASTVPDCKLQVRDVTDAAN